VFFLHQKTISVTWTVPSNLTYNGESKNPTARVTGLIDGDGTTYSVAITSGNGTDGKAINAGDYTFELVLEGENAADYSISSGATKSFTIMKQRVTALWNVFSGIDLSFEVNHNPDERQLCPVVTAIRREGSSAAIGDVDSVVTHTVYKQNGTEWIAVASGGYKTVDCPSEVGTYKIEVTLKAEYAINYELPSGYYKHFTLYEDEV
jgi:hypothetical protein